MDLKQFFCCMSRSNDGRNIIKDTQRSPINNGLSGAQTDKAPIALLNENYTSIKFEKWLDKYSKEVRALILSGTPIIQIKEDEDNLDANEI